MSAEDEWQLDKSMALLDASPEEYKAATGFNSAAEILNHKAEGSALRELQKELWPTPVGSGNTIKIKAKRPLTADEVKIILKTIKQEKLLTEMFSANMFGGYGMDVYEHESYPGTGPVFLLRITEYDLPKEMNSQLGKPSGGCGSTDAWELFSQYTHSKQNREWLKMYNYPAPQERYHYDY